MNTNRTGGTMEHTMHDISVLVGQVIELARTLTVDEVDQWAKVARSEAVRHDTLTSMLDPTAYMIERPGVDAAARVSEAFAQFRHVVESAVAA